MDIPIQVIMRNTVFLLTKDDIFQPVAGSLHCLLKLVPPCYTICLSTQWFIYSFSQLTTDPAVVKPLWSFHWGNWRNVSSISIKWVKGLGKRLSNPCIWHHHPPFLSGQKNQKTCFCLISIMAKQRDTVCWKGLKASHIFLFAGHTEWRTKFRVRATSGTDQTKKTKDRVVSIFQNESLRNNPTWNDIAKLFALRVLGEQTEKHYLTLGKYTQMSNMKGWPAEKLYITYDVPTPVATKRTVYGSFQVLLDPAAI